MMFVRVLALATLASASKVSVLPQSKVLALRGGMDLGPVDADLVNGILKVGAAVTAAGAITEKYAGIGETTVTKFFKGDVWNTNLIISMVTGATSPVLYSMGASPWEAAEVTSVLWLLSVLSKLKDANFDVSTLTNDPVETGVAVLATVLAFG